MLGRVQPAQAAQAPTDVDPFEQSKSRGARTIRARRGRSEVRIGALLYPEKVHAPPKTRGECVNGIRPCPYVRCRYHLWADVNDAGGLRVNFPDVEPWDLRWSCALDVVDAAAGPLTLETVGRLLNITRERVRQIENSALMRANARLQILTG